MSKIIKKRNDLYSSQEVIDTPPTELVEENVYVDETYIKNKELIRIDLNIIQFPIFSKNTRRKINQIVKYSFNQNRDTYITVTPSAGDYIPGEMEEKVFIALMQIMKERNMARKIIISATDLRDKIKMNTYAYGAIFSKALSRLATTNYTFKNTLYSSEYKGTIDQEIKTTIFNIRTITLSKKENKKYREAYSDRRVKVIYEIEFSEHFYKNIIEKGYMVYNGNTLLEIESSTARTIYMLIEKLRFDSLYLRLDTIFLIKRIPLKDDKRNLTQTIKTLDKAFKELKERNLVKDFKFIKDSTWGKSEIEIYFDEKSKEDKQERFFEDRNDFKKMMSSLTVSATEHDMIDEVEVVNLNKTNLVTKELVNKVISLMPSKAKELKTMPKTIKEAVEKYGYEKVKNVALYMKKNKVEKVRTYFLKALENNWVEDEEIIVLEPLKSTKKESELNFNTNISNHDESLYIEFEKLSIEIQNGIETYAYKDYVKECGMDTKIQKLAFSASRKIHICRFLEKYPEILGDISNKKIVLKNEETIKEKFMDLEEVKEVIKETVEMADLVNNYEENEKKKLMIEILKEVMPILRDKRLTIQILTNILNRYTGI